MDLIERNGSRNLRAAPGDEGCRRRRAMMKRAVCILLLYGLLNPLSVGLARSSTVKVDVVHSQDHYPVNGTYQIILNFNVESSWYIHSTHEEGGLIPTALTFKEKPGFTMRMIQFPQPQKVKFEYTDEPVEVFSGAVPVRVAFKVEPKAAAEEQVLEGKLSYQACSTSSCLPPEELPVRLSLSIVPPGTPTQAINQELFEAATLASTAPAFPGTKPGAGLWLTLLGIFLGGLALNLTPCIYPLIPITVSYFGGRSQKFSAHVLIHGVLYICGLAVTNSVLGVSAALSGEMIGTALQNPFVVVFIAGLMLALALSFFGFWEFRLPGGLTKVASKNYGGFFGTFFMGLTLGIVAAPCLGPFILGLLTYVGQKRDPLLGFLYFFVLSIGMGLPLSVLAIFSGAIHKLPMSGDWMIWVRKLLGWVLVGMAAYMLRFLIPHDMGDVMLIAGVAVVAGIHLGWLERTGGAVRRFGYLKKALGIILIGLGISYPLYASQERAGIRWTPYDQALIASAAQEQKPAILDFSADWCIPCKELEHLVFKDPEIIKLARRVVALRLDLTQDEEEHEEILKQYEVRGVPTVVFLNRDGEELKDLRIESFVGKDVFLARLKGLLDDSSGAPE
jgi:thiol:disulfide interchange protein DsbD